MRRAEDIPASLQEALGSKYHVLQWIGGGGMAQVYLARNQTTGGLFAVKVLAAHFAGQDAIVDRFLQEARTSAALSGHPNIVSIFDVGQSKDTHYIIMQYVEGDDLSALLKRVGKFPPIEAARIVEQIAAALVFAHEHNVVHRDLKPSNVKIQKSGRVVVLDFGIAKAGDAPSQLTSAGQRLGTPYYMSPEHFITGVCDRRSDLYALGVVFFELLTGRRPFDGDSVQDIEIAHREHPAPSPRNLDHEIPEAYAQIVLRLLAKRPEDRYECAADLIADIRRAAGSGSPPAMPASLDAAEPIAPPSAAPRRSSVPALAAGAALAAVVAAGLWFATTSRGSMEPAATPAADVTRVDAAVVTNTEYKAFCDATGHPYPDPPADNPNYFYANPDEPALNITYPDAVAFSAWAGKRLPTAQEWDSGAWQNTLAPGIAEWTSTRFTPSEADLAAIRKLAGSEPQGDWYVIKGNPALQALPSNVRPRGVAIGFRCVKNSDSEGKSR